MFGMRRVKNSRQAAGLLILCSLWPSQALGQRHSHEHQQKSEAGGPGVIEMQTVSMKIPDLALLDQDGRKVRLYSDLIRGRVVVLSFFFTRCVNICLTQGLTLKRLKARLADRFGRDVFFISVSKDPRRDTPQRLKQWGVQFGVGPGWSLVTGKEQDIDGLSLRLTAEEAATPSHSPVLIIGNDLTGVWRAASGEATTQELLEVVDSVAGSAVASGR